MEKRYSAPTKKSISKDIDAILWAFRLEKIRRYIHQKYWIKESQDASYANKIEQGLKLESVAEHSWKVADTVLLLVTYFPYLDQCRCLKLAILHDKMEIFAGDPSPVGRDGTGTKGHAFNKNKAQEKKEKEQQAIIKYLKLLRPDIRNEQENLLNEMLESSSLESRFVKAIDKIEATSFILLKKNGNIENRHLRFLVKFHDKNWRYFPPLKGYYDELLERLFKKVAKFRGISKNSLKSEICRYQQNLFSLTNNNIHEEWKKARIQLTTTNPSKKERLVLLLKKMDEVPPAYSSLDAFRQIATYLNSIEDKYIGVKSWHPPRFYPPKSKTERLYPTSPDSMFPIESFNGVEALICVGEIIFISRYGAIEIQIRQEFDNVSNNRDFHHRKDLILYKKNDYQGDEVWHEKNRS